MGKEKTLCFARTSNLAVLFTKRRDKKPGKMQAAEKRSLLVASHCTAGLGEQLCKLSQSLSSGKEQVRNKKTSICGVRDHGKFVTLTELPFTNHFRNGLAAPAKCLSRGQKEQMNVQIRAFLIMLSIVCLQYTKQIWKGYIICRKSLLPSPYLWTNVKSTSVSNF